MPSIDSIKEDTDLRTYVGNDLGAPQNHTSIIWMFRCPFHEDDSASFAVYKDHYHCYGCQAHGSIFDYVMNRMGKSFREAAEFLNAELELPEYKQRQVPKEEKPVQMSLDLDEQLRRHYDVSKVNPYLEQRNIHQPVIDANMIGASQYRKTYVDLNGHNWQFQCNRVALPYIFADRVYSLNFRRDDLSAQEYLERVGQHYGVNLFDTIRADIARKKGVDIEKVKREHVMFHCFGTRFYRPSTPVTAYGVHSVVCSEGDKLIYPRRSYAILTEGEFNQLSCQSLNFTSIAVKPVKNVNLRRLLQSVRLVIVAVDPDEAGLKYAEGIMAALGGDYTKVRMMQMPQGYKDMNDLHKANELGNFLSGKPFYLDPVA